jgi:hypothetical protein
MHCPVAEETAGPGAVEDADTARDAEEEEDDDDPTLATHVPSHPLPFGFRVRN